MNIDRFEGRMTQFRGAAKAKWGELTDDQLDQLDGEVMQLTGLIQEVYGIAKDQAEKDVRSFLWEMQVDAWSNELQGGWTAMKGAIKQNWGKLTDDEITEIEGRAEKLVGVIQHRYAVEEAFAVEDVAKFMRAVKKAAKEAGA